MKAICLTLSVVILFLTGEMSQSHNILFLSFPVFSHVNPMSYLARELHKRGHNSYIPVPEELTKKLIASKGVNFIPLKENKVMKELIKKGQQFFSQNQRKNFKELLKSVEKVCDCYLLDSDWFQSLKALNASLILVDGVFMSFCLSIIPYKLSVPFVFMSVQNSPNIHRTPWAFPAFPILPTKHFEVMDIFERMKNVLAYISIYFSSPMGSPSKELKYYAPDKPKITFEQLLRKAALFIVESDFLLDNPLPSLPNLEYLGGMGTQPAKQLQGDLLKFVNSSKTGIIVVSFGSIISSLPEEHARKMAEAFKKIKYDVVWKSSNTSHSAANVFLTKWMPQNDLLGHPKTKLFITHCGNGGQFEALYHGVPMLGFPVFGDQPHNAKRMQHKGYGISMDLYHYKIEDLVENINEIIDNPKYKRNIKRASDIFKSRPEHPSVRGARIVDDVIKYGGGFLRSYCQDMPLYEYFMLDILAVVLSSALIAIAIIIFILRKCLSFCYKKKEKKE